MGVKCERWFSHAVDATKINTRKGSNITARKKEQNGRNRSWKEVRMRTRKKGVARSEVKAQRQHPTTMSLTASNIGTFFLASGC